MPETAVMPDSSGEVLGRPDDAPRAGYRLGDDFVHLQNASIMMIDDEPIMMEVVQTFLEDAGYCRFTLVEDSTTAKRQ